MTERRSLDTALLLWGVFGVCVSGLILLTTLECEVIAGILRQVPTGLLNRVRAAASAGGSCLFLLPAVSVFLVFEVFLAFFLEKCWERCNPSKKVSSYLISFGGIFLLSLPGRWAAFSVPVFRSPRKRARRLFGLFTLTAVFAAGAGGKRGEAGLISRRGGSIL